MRKEILQSFIIGFIFLTAGIVLLQYELIGYGLSFFVFLPFVLGYILGRPVVKQASLIGLILALVVFLLLLIGGGLEGMGCVLMSLPIVIPILILGVYSARIINGISRRKNEKDKDRDLIKASVIPLLLFIGLGLTEKFLTANKRETISVKTEMILPYSPIEVYDVVKSVDTLTGAKPFLMKIDLPIPEKCVLDKEEVGGVRTCYFSGGTITERITELEKGKVLRMDVIDYQLTGRKWLGFKEAIYYFDRVGNDSCKLTRITTYTSELMPRFYWQPLETLGIRQEHDYVFANVKNDCKSRYRR